MVIWSKFTICVFINEAIRKCEHYACKNAFNKTAVGYITIMSLASNQLIFYVICKVKSGANVIECCDVSSLTQCQSQMTGVDQIVNMRFTVMFRHYIHILSRLINISLCFSILDYCYYQPIPVCLYANEWPNV